MGFGSKSDKKGIIDKKNMIVGIAINGHGIVVWNAKKLVKSRKIKWEK